MGKKLVIDIECSGLLEHMLDYTSFPYKLKPDAKLWCVVITNVDTGESAIAEKEKITKEWLKNQLKDCTSLIGHNVLKFDLIVLRLFGILDYKVGYLNQSDIIFDRECKIVDTLVISRLFNPDRFGGHSLESWGERLGVEKINFRQVCIDKGYIERGAPRGEEFQTFCPEMTTYCVQDTNTNCALFLELVKEAKGYDKWSQAVKIENKLADQAVRRENLGFFFDKKLALECLEDLGTKMQELHDRVVPILPKKPMNKGELSHYTLPKVQFLKNGEPSSHLLRAVERLNAELIPVGDKYQVKFQDKTFDLPYTEPLKVYVDADMGDLDHVKMHLINLGWNPTEWRERDLTKNAKKQALPYDKRVIALQRWFDETMEGKYKESRLAFLDIDPKKLFERLKKRLAQDFPVRVPTSPCVRVGVEKELCPNLVALGEKVDFAKDFALYLTYKHRKASIAGGNIEDMDFDCESPNTGYLSLYREDDGRIATPSIEIGAATNRYRHIGVANIPRATSIYGKEMRSLFGCGDGAFQFGYDFSSLEARINGHYVIKYPNGEELATAMLAEKPNDIHSVNARKLDISRTDAKSLTYAILYGAQPAKVAKMLRIALDKATTIYNGFWDVVPALKKLKSDTEKFWEETDSTYIEGIDGRKINVRSKHSILNFLFQSAGVICAKYVNVLSMQYLEEQGFCIDPFEGEPDICEMVAYHDECQLRIKKELSEFKMFDSEEEAKEFCANWQDDQLSAISEGKKWYVCMPNSVSKAIAKAIKTTEELLKLNVNLGFEWIVNKTWYGCH